MYHHHFICPIIQQYVHLHEYNFRRAGQQGPIRTLTAALKHSIKTVTVYIFYHTHTFNGPFPGLPGWAGTRKVKPIWILLKQERQWVAVASAGHMQDCTSLQTDNHASTSPISFLQAGCPSCRPTNSVKAVKSKLVFTFLVPAHPGSPGKRAVKCVCVIGQCL